jgi:hypothetical protein
MSTISITDVVEAMNTAEGMRPELTGDAKKKHAMNRLYLVIPDQIYHRNETLIKALIDYLCALSKSNVKLKINESSV